MNEQMYAVITGDVSKSSRFSGANRTALLDVLGAAFGNVENILGPDVMALPFEIYRGDSFQGVVKNTGHALKVAVLIRATLRNYFKTTVKQSIDARMAIGIGTIEYWPKKAAGEGDGEAYRNSGPVLDKMVKHSRMILVTTPDQEINKELNVECALLDTIISRWSHAQADVVLETLKGKTQEEMAELFNISQPAVRKRVNAANLFALQLMLERFTHITHDYQQTRKTES